MAELPHLKRSIFPYLLEWKERQSRKVLLLRGARQVGKTFIIRELGTKFKYFIEINLLEEPRIAALFSQGSLDPKNIISAISAYKGIPIVDGETLLFIDEIQVSPDAIAALRFFYEKRPNLHVVASGSLLNFALENTESFGVGRVEYLYMYPLTFEEYLISQKEELLVEQIKKATPSAPLAEPLHFKALSLYKSYLCIGGMPGIVARHSSVSPHQTSIAIGDIITGYEDDFAKYKKKLNIGHIRETFRSTSLQVGKKFIYSHAFRDANSKVVHQALELLVNAGIVHKVYHSDANNGEVLASEVDLKKFKVIPHDIGIFNRLNGVQIDDLALLNPLDLIHKGALAEASCGLELLWSQPPFAQEPLYYWHREAKSSNAEVDYVISIDNRVIPIEVKASGKGAMHSMRAFLKAKGATFGVRCSTENFGKYDEILTVPIYAVREIERVLRQQYESILETKDILEDDPDILKKLKKAEAGIAKGDFTLWKPKPKSKKKLH